MVKEEKNPQFPPENHRVRWNEADIFDALKILQDNHLNPGDINDDHAEALNEKFNRNMSAASWRRTYRKWVITPPVPYRLSEIKPPAKAPDDATPIEAELQKLRAVKARVDAVCKYLDNNSQFSSNRIMAVYLRTGDATQLFEEVMS